MEQVKVGIIGCGAMSPAHIKAVRENANAELVALCDIHEEHVAALCEEYHVGGRYTDYRELLAKADVDAVIIVTPDQSHREITVAALAAGKHVLCEKPMAMTMEDCRAMIAAARASDRKVMVGQIGRFTPAFVAAKELIDRGEIGELFFVETEYAHDYCRIPGVDGWRLDALRHGFLGGGCHAVDFARWIAGNPVEVMAYANRKMLPTWPTDDCTVAIMKYPNNVIGKVFVSTGCKRDYTMRSVFYGSNGTIIVDNTNPTMTVYQDGLCGGTTLLKDVAQSHAVPIKYPVSVSNHNTIEEFRVFCDCIRNDTPVEMDAVEGARTVAVCLAVVEAAAKGVPVKPDYDL